MARFQPHTGQLRARGRGRRHGEEGKESERDGNNRANHPPSTSELQSGSKVAALSGSQAPIFQKWRPTLIWLRRSDEHTSELQSLMRISYAVFCLKTKQSIRQVIHNR